MSESNICSNNIDPNSKYEDDTIINLNLISNTDQNQNQKLPSDSLINYPDPESNIQYYIILSVSIIIVIIIIIYKLM